jgi:murein DD-endopeptidase MepM/ murein hydrolase activator NlpD
MESKKYTLVIAPNREGRTWTFTVSAAWIRAGIGISFVLLLLLLTVLTDYGGLLLKARENTQLRTENKVLKKQFSEVEEKVSSLEAGLDRIQTLTKKLKLITDVNDQNRALKLAYSASTQPAVDETSDDVDVTEPVSDSDRKPSSEMWAADPLRHADDIPVDTGDGELAQRKELVKDFATLSVRIDRVLKNSQLREQSLIKVWDSLSDRKSLLAATPSIKPALGWYTSRFGYRVDPMNRRPRLHAGLDIGAPYGTPVHATADGIVSFAGYEGGYGKMVAIDNGYGVVTRFAHNSRIYVEQGQKVHRWDVIAAVGSTGRSTGPHCHYEVRVHGVPVDPINYILEE